MSDQYSRFLRRNKRLIEKMYVHQIAKTIAENAKPKIRPEWFPNIPNPPAMRLAIEYVSDWLADKKMDLTLDIAKLESNSLLGVDRHQAGWVERKLELEVYEPVIPQLINIKRSSKERGLDNNEKKMPKKGQLSTEKDLRLVQSSDDSEFSEQSILDDAIAKRNELLEHNMKKHKHHHHKSPLESKTRDLAKRKADEVEAQIRINEFDTFTESSDDEANIWDPQYGLDKEKRNELEEKKKLAAERKELRKAQEDEKKRRQERKKHRRTETSQYSYSTYGTNPSDYSYYSTENSYSRTSGHHHRHSHGHRHHRSNTRSDYSYSTYGTYQTPTDYSYGSYSTTGYSYTSTQQQPTQTATQQYQTQTQTRAKATKQDPQSSNYQSFTSPPNTTIQVPAPPLPPPSGSSYASGYTDIDTRPDTASRANGNPSEYSYSYSTNTGSYYSYSSYAPSYEYSQTYQTQNRRGGKKGPGTWTELEQNQGSAVYVAPSPFAPNMVSRSTSEHSPMYMPPPSINSQNISNFQRSQQQPPSQQAPPPPQMRRQPPVQRPYNAQPNAKDFLQKFNENENDATGEGTTDILRNYANPPTQGTQNGQGNFNDYFGPGNKRNPGVIVHQENIVEEQNIYQ